MIRMQTWKDILINDKFCFDPLEETWRDDGIQSNDLDSEGARILSGKLTSKFYLSNKPFPSSPGPLYQNEVKSSAFDVEMIFHSHSNKTHLHKKGCALGLILKVRVFGTWKWTVLQLV